MNATQRSSRWTNVPGISPAMMRLKMVVMDVECTLGRMEAEALAPNRYLTVPNAFTLVRLCCIPLFLYLLFGRDNQIAAAWLLGGLGATDWVDGWLARRLNQTSEFGKMFDPTVDRICCSSSAIGGIIVAGAAPLWVCWAVVIREVVLGGTVAIATLFFGMKRFDVTWLGKLATFLLMFAFPGFMLGSSTFPGHQLLPDRVVDARQFRGSSSATTRRSPTSRRSVPACARAAKTAR